MWFKYNTISRFDVHGKARQNICGYVHTIKSTNALMLKLYFTHNCHNSYMFRYPDHLPGVINTPTLITLRTVATQE